MNHSNPFRRAQRALSALAVSTALLVLSGASASAEPLHKFSLGQLREIVKSEGYGSVSVHDDHVRFKANGRMYGLYLYDDGDLQMYYGISGVSSAGTSSSGRSTRIPTRTRSCTRRAPCSREKSARPREAPVEGWPGSNVLSGTAHRICSSSTGSNGYRLKATRTARSAS